MAAPTPEPEILYEDNHLLVVVKPFGMLSQGDKTGDANLVDWAKADLKRRYAKPGNVFAGLVHRLDRPAGGVLVLARTSKAAGRLSAQFRERLVAKDYVALVETAPRPPAGRLEGWLVPGRDGKSSTIHHREVAGAQRAALEYRSEPAPGTLVRVALETGRKHQIRAQLAHAGWPIRGDRRYGARREWPRGQIALFAERLTIEHPTKREPLTFTAPLPAGWGVAP